MSKKYTPEELLAINAWRNNHVQYLLDSDDAICIEMQKERDGVFVAGQYELPPLSNNERRCILEELNGKVLRELSIARNPDALLRKLRDSEELQRQIVVLTCRALRGELDAQVKNRAQYETLKQEFDRQIKNLLAKGFPKLVGMDEATFVAVFEPLREHLKELSSKEFKKGHIPFIVVPGEKLLSLKEKVPLMELDGKKGYTPLDLFELKTAEGVEIPKSLAYVLIDVEDGTGMCWKTPNTAVARFKEEGRSPMTADEGVALILQYPEILKDHLMDLPGSRYGGNGVASLWLGGGRPGLLWSWANCSGAERGGSASCGSRVGL